MVRLVVGWLQANLKIAVLIYENEDILVAHNIATFSNCSREAIVQSILLKDGLLWREKMGQRYYLQVTKLMQSYEFRHLSFKELLVQKKIWQRAISRSRDAQKVKNIIA